MSAPATYGQLANLGSGANARIYTPWKNATGLAGTIQNRYYDTFGMAAGSIVAGATPTTAVVPTRSTLGALGQANPGGGRKLWLTYFQSMSASVVGGAWVYDRLSHMGGLSGNVSTTQTTNLPTAALTRYTDGTGNELIAQIYTTVGTTPRTMTVTYTDNVNGASRVTQAVDIGIATDSNAAPMVLCLPLQSGDSHPVSIQSFAIATGGTGTVGNIGLSIIHRLGRAGSGTGRGGTGVAFGFDTQGFPEVKTDACLAMLVNGVVQNSRMFFELAMLEN